MKRTLLLPILLLSLFGAGAFLAAPATPAPQTADLTQLRQAIFPPDPAAGLDPLDGALPMRTCVPTGDPCIDAQCNCAAQCSFSCGIGSFTCNESTGAHTCKCKGC
ncbi:MAG TPA: hypothetical protein VGR07_23175 [Thermoanaerobaculia bacterium]|jgi:hypothetical protein|nr:hypothetical protein [Thermoanaerobaculia bacterium]